ncbi:C48 family peptidase (plasmid) [Bradyrhizobium septentrionale]|uniref:Ulp1 family isopeptidase n=1 Tax=Bradyrhizobium septentrionale TaxID=1404411 RepID=UPI001CD654D0|nr:Ulp1 family isopeptidase [Bradyrhizobium septentrionale]UGY30314.1 C48 family peptidase [Bradyrhizobium septentrionale]
MDFPSIKWVREQPDSTGPQESSPTAPSAEAATVERQLSEIANSSGGGGAMPAAAALQPAQSAGVLIGRQSKQPLYSEDARLISGLEKVLIKGNAANQTAYSYVSSLRSFSRWLFANNKDPIAARLDDQSLTDDAREFAGNGKSGLLLKAIDHLRTFQSTGGVVPITGRAELNPHPQDVALIEEYKNEAATGTGRQYAVSLRSFSDYLRKSSKPGIAARLSGNTLDEDVKRYRKDAGWDRNIGAALADLRKSQAGAKAMELERHISPVLDPEDAVLMEPRRVGGAAAQHSASQDAGSRPLVLPEGYDQDLLWELMDEPGPSSSLEPAARHDQSSDPGETIRPLNWGYDRQQFLDEPMAALARSNLLPSEEVLINDEHDTAELRPAKRPRTLDNLHGLASERQLSEIANSNGGGGAMPAASALQPAQSAGVLKGRSKQPLYSEDARLISGLGKALIKGPTAYSYVSSLRSFGRWLFENNKDPIAARLDDQSLTDDAREAIEKGHNRRLRPAIDYLRTVQSTGGDVPITGRADLNPHPQDVALIEEYKNEAATATGRMYASVLRSFSDYLRENNKKGIAGRLSGNTLDEDVKRYRKDAGGNRRIGAALADLRKSQAGAKAMELERYISPVLDPENAVLMEPMLVGDAAAQHSASQDAGSWLLPVEGYDQDLLWELMDEPGPSSSLEPAARHDQSSDPGETIRPLNWGYDRQQFLDEPMAALARSNLLPSEEVLINDEHDTAELRPAKRPRTLDNLHGLASERQLSEIANSNGGGGAMPAASALQPAQSAGVLKGRRKQPLYSEDARLISGLGKALIKGPTAYSYVSSLRSFGRWLFENNKDPIAARLDDQSLTDDAREAIEKGHNRRLRPAIDRLRTFQSTGGGAVPITGRAELNPHPQDVALIEEYKNEAATGTGRMYATALRSFSDYLRENNKKGIAARLSGNTLDEDVKRYRKDAGGNRRIGAALADLRKSQAGAKAMELDRYISPVPDPEDAALMEPWRVGDAAAQHSASQDAGSRPLVLPEGYDQDLLWELMDEPGPSSSLEPAARHDQSSDPGETIRPLNWGYDRQQFLDEPMAALARSNLLPSEEVLINDEHDTAELRPAKRPRTLDNLHGLASERQLSEIANSNGGGGAMPAASALQPAQSAGVLKGRRKQPLYSEDARLISGLEEVLIKGNAANQTAYSYVSSLRSFSRWLFANNKDPIAARLDDQSLTDDAREAIEKGHYTALRPAIDHLRTFQSTGEVVPIKGRAELNPHPQDVALIKEYKNEAATGTGKSHATALRSFSDYLRKSSKPGIAARLSGNTLGEDVKRYRKDAGGNRRIGAALADLRKSQAGAKAMEFERYISPVPDPEDAALMEPWRVGDAAAQHSAPQGAVSQPLVLPEGYDQDLLWELMDEPGPSSSLEPAARHDQSSDPGESIRPLNWGYDRQQFPDESMGALARSNLLPSEEVLINDEHDTAELRPAKRPRPLDNLHGLASERQLSEIANSGGRLLTSAPTHRLGASPWQAQPMMQASGHEDATAPHAVATYVGGAAAQHSAPQGAVSRPLVLPEGYDQDLRLMVEDGPPWSGVPPEQAQEIVQAGEQEPARSTSTWSPQMPLDFDWSMWPILEAASAPAAKARSDTYGGLESFVDLDAPTPSELRDDAHFEPAPSARARSDTYRGFPLVDLTAPPPSESRDDANSVRPFPSTSADAQIGALGPTASSHGRGLVLEDTEWLGDEHIDRDYRLQEQDLQRYHPDLAARTRFVNPLIVLNYLRSNDDGVVRTEFQRIVYDNGNDTADFLFLPVINAVPEDPNSLGNHWSLLFVDRSDRGRPVAYHYDSYGGLNDTDAEHLAGRLDLHLEPAGMARQRNGYDCGVFVVDGTRALVRQLEQGREPHLLNLSNLVANRQALQNRLRG